MRKNNQQQFLRPTQVKGVRKGRWKRRLWIFALIYGVFFVLFLFAVLIPGRRLGLALNGMIGSLQSIKSAASEQNLSGIEAGFDDFENELTKTEKALSSFAYLNQLPFTRAYYQDGVHLVGAGKQAVELGKSLTGSLEPIADIVGFSKEGEPAEDISAEEKMSRVAVALPTMLPELENAQTVVDSIAAEVSQIDPNRYPVRIGKNDIRSRFEELGTQVNQIKHGLAQAIPIFSQLPDVMGIGKTRHYMILFQNDKELRPSGGFITAYAIIRFEGGAFSIVESSDIYKLDNEATYLPTPEVITQFLRESGWFLRDTNLSPDYKSSAETFLVYYDQMGHMPVDGVFAIDTYFVQSFLKILGEVKLDAYPEVFTSENIVEQLEVYTQITLGGSPERKELIGDLMNEIVAKALNAPKNIWSSLIETGFEQVTRKHILFYFREPEEQQIVESLKAGGRIEQTSSDADYINVNLANFAGLKGNWFTTMNIEQNVSIDSDLGVKKTVTLKFDNAGEYSVFNKILKMYVRIYTPLGSELLSSTGSEIDPEVLTEQDKTVFTGFVNVPAESQASITFEYKLPNSFGGRNYKLLMQKQPGTEGNTYVVNVEKNGVVDSMSGTLDKDIWIDIPLSGS